MTYQELNKELNISKKDYKELVKHSHVIEKILDGYKYKRDTKYKDEVQMSKRDELKDIVNRLKHSLANMKEFVK